MLRDRICRTIVALGGIAFLLLWFFNPKFSEDEAVQTPLFNGRKFVFGECFKFFQTGRKDIGIFFVDNAFQFGIIEQEFAVFAAAVEIHFLSCRTGGGVELFYHIFGCTECGTVFVNEFIKTFFRISNHPADDVVFKVTGTHAESSVIVHAVKFEIAADGLEFVIDAFFHAAQQR